jgi:hypothetical protein
LEAVEATEPTAVMVALEKAAPEVHLAVTMEVAVVVIPEPEIVPVLMAEAMEAQVEAVEVLPPVFLQMAMAVLE